MSMLSVTNQVPLHSLQAEEHGFLKKRINILFDGLEKDAKYRFSFQNREYIKSGAYMANVGIPAHIHGAYYNEIVLLDKLNN